MRVLSVHGPLVALWGQRGRVLSAHARAVNLMLEGGAVVSLLAPELGNGPGACVVDGEWPLPWCPGDEVALGGSLEGAERWEPGAGPELGLPSAVRGEWGRAVAACSSLGRGLLPVTLSLLRDGETCLRDGETCLRDSETCLRDGETCSRDSERCAGMRGDFETCLGDFETCLRDGERFVGMRGGAPLQSVLADFALPGLRALRDGRWADAVAGLCGLGPGLTPSGDDLLAGFACLSVRAGWKAGQGPIALLKEIPDGQTTILSRSFLHWAADGVASERALTWVDQLLTGRPAPVGPVLAIGATSGADWVAGALLALDLCLKEVGA